MSSTGSGPAPPAGARAIASGCRGWPIPAGACRFCLSGRENLCLSPRFTGWDVDGGYAEYAVVEEAYAYALARGFRRRGGRTAAVRRDHRLPGAPAGEPPRGRPARDLRVRGLGAHHGAGRTGPWRPRPCHDPVGRGAGARARSSAPTSVGAADAAPPEPLDSAILFAPVGTLVPPALAALDRGGTLAIAGIHLSDIPVLNYQGHLFEERTLQSVTANTRQDGEEFLAEAARIRLRVAATPYPMDRADAALRDLGADRVNGAAVLVA